MHFLVERLVSFYSIGFNFARIVGPPLGRAHYLDRCRRLFGFLSGESKIPAGELLGVRIRSNAPASGPGSLFSEFKEGIRNRHGAADPRKQFGCLRHQASLSGHTPGSSPSLPKTYLPSVRTGPAHGLAFTAAVSITLTALTFWRLLRKTANRSGNNCQSARDEFLELF